MKGAANRRAAEAVGGKNHQAPDRHRDRDAELAAWARQEVAAWPPLTTDQLDLVSRALGGAATVAR